MGKDKIAFVVVRYGADINGGAEYHCRMLAERLVDDYDVEVLTTCVKDYMKGGNDIAEGAEYINRVMVRRFKVDPIRDMTESEYLKRAKPVRRLRMFLYRIRGLRLFSYFIPVWTYYRQEELESMRRCVFYSSQLHQFIKENKDVYKAFIALTIDYTPFYYTAILAGEKSIAIPTMHYTKISFRGVLTEAFSKFAYVGFNTKAEQKLGERVFGKALGAHGIISVGIEPIKAANWEETKRKYRLPDKYLLCVGRVEKAKVNDLITCFSNYKQQYKESSLKLVMVGGIFGKVPDAAEVIYTGFVSDEEKIAIIQHAFLVVNPSQYESLSLILLETLNLEIPMLVNGRCAVLKEHCKLSHGAVDYYMNEQQFIRKLNKIESFPVFREQMAKGGKQYVDNNYNWNLILSRLKRVIELVAKSKQRK